MFVVIFRATIRQAGLKRWRPDYSVQITKIERHYDSKGATA